MNTFTILALFLIPFLLVGAIESHEQRDIYQHCINQGAGSVYTDMDAELLERSCKQ